MRTGQSWPGSPARILVLAGYPGRLGYEISQPTAAPATSFTPWLLEHHLTRVYHIAPYTVLAWDGKLLKGMPR
jgi:hypothetical protein